MKYQNFLKALLAATLFSAATFAQALTVDTFLGKTNNANSGPTAELAGLSTVLADYNASNPMSQIVVSGTLTLEQSVDIGAIMQDGTSFFYDVAPATPSFFLLKFGGGNVAFTDYYFANIAELTKLVFTNAQVDGLIDFADCAANDCKLSHYSIINSDDTPPNQRIPEPALPLLLGSGLIGLYIARRFRRA